MKFQRVAPEGLIAKSVKAKYLFPLREKVVCVVVNGPIDRGLILIFVLGCNAPLTFEYPQKGGKSHAQQ
jgi:hypothetical protein